MTSYLCSIVTMGLSRTVFEINDNICQIFPPHISLKGFPSDFVTVVALEKLVMPLSGLRLECDDMCIHLDTIPKCDRRTDR